MVKKKVSRPETGADNDGNLHYRGNTESITSAATNPVDAGESLRHSLGGAGSRVFLSGSDQLIDLGSSPYPQSSGVSRYYNTRPHTLSGFPGAEMVTIPSSASGSIGGRLLIKPPRWSSAVYRTVGMVGGFAVWILTLIAILIVALSFTVIGARLFTVISIQPIPQLTLSDTTVEQNFIISSLDRFAMLWFIPTLALTGLLVYLAGMAVKYLWSVLWSHLMKVRAGLFAGYGRGFAQDMDYRQVTKVERKELKKWYKRQRRIEKHDIKQLRRGEGIRRKREKVKIKKDIATARSNDDRL